MDQHLCWGQVRFLCHAAEAAVKLAMHDTLACQSLPCRSDVAIIHLTFSLLQSLICMLDAQIRGMGRHGQVLRAFAVMLAVMLARVVSFVSPQ